jgi:hypothetical protein
MRPNETEFPPDSIWATRWMKWTHWTASWKVRAGPAADPRNLFKLGRPSRIALFGGHRFGQGRVAVGEADRGGERPDHRVVEEAALAGAFAGSHRAELLARLRDDPRKPALEDASVIHREVADAVGDLEDHGERERAHLFGDVGRQQLLESFLGSAAAPEGEDVFRELPRLDLADAHLLDDAILEGAEVALDPARLVLGKEGSALQLAGPAADDELVFADDGADVVEDVPEGPAHAGDRGFVPVSRHRLGEITGAFDARLSRRVDDSLSKPRYPARGTHLGDGLRRRCCHAPLPYPQWYRSTGSPAGAPPIVTRCPSAAAGWRRGAFGAGRGSAS